MQHIKATSRHDEIFVVFLGQALFTMVRWKNRIWSKFSNENTRVNKDICHSYISYDRTNVLSLHVSFQSQRLIQVSKAEPIVYLSLCCETFEIDRWMFYLFDYYKVITWTPCCRTCSEYFLVSSHDSGWPSDRRPILNFAEMWIKPNISNLHW